MTHDERGDLKAVAPIVVLPPFSGEIGLSAEDQDDEEADDSDEGLAFRFERDAWREGESLAAALAAEPASDVIVTEVRIELVRHETVWGEITNSHTTTVARQILSKEMSLRGGVRAEFPFRLDIPIALASMIDTPHGYAKLLVKATLARRLKKDLHAEEIAVVYSSSREHVPATMR